MTPPLVPLYISFNPRPCARGDRGETQWQPLQDQFQSTPLREGRLLERADMIGVAGVSIHAPARGATIWRGPGVCGPGVSIHAPARGATCLGLRYYQLSNVSIHAPARGATFLHDPSQLLRNVSIHAPARGATSNTTPYLSRDVFQSTPLREGRPGRHAIPVRGACFNPRPCARGDL